MASTNTFLIELKEQTKKTKLPYYDIALVILVKIAVGTHLSVIPKCQVYCITLECHIDYHIKHILYSDCCIGSTNV